MGQIKDLTEKTSVADNDVFAGDDSADSNKSKKYKFSTIFSGLISKIGATAAEIASVCSGNTATAAEIKQICDGRTAGGTGTSDIVTVGGSQLLINKGLTLPGFNGDSTGMELTGQQLNTMKYVTGSGRVNEVQQGLNTGESTITSGGASYTKHGLVNVNLSSSDSLSFGPVSSYNVSEEIVIKNISATAAVTVNRLGSDRFYTDGTGYVRFILTAGESIALMAMGSNRWMVRGYTEATFS